MLLGGVRVPKDDPRVAAYGAVDELNSALGLAAALAMDGGGAPDARLRTVQEDLFTVGARLAAADPDRAIARGTIPVLDPARIEALERWMRASRPSTPSCSPAARPRERSST